MRRNDAQTAPASRGRATLVVTMLLAVSAAIIGWAWLSNVATPPVSAPPPPPPADSTWTEQELYGPCIVTQVIDGDTVDTLCAGSKMRVRLLRVDTPERDQPGYEEARAALERLIGTRPLNLVFEKPGVPSWGTYGRLLAYLITERGENLNLEMVRRGWSAFYRDFGEGRFAQSFTQAETAARQERLGLWSGSLPAKQAP